MASLDLDVPDHVEVNDRAVQLGVDDSPQGFEDLLARRAHVVYPSSGISGKNSC
jgi:hypothetical protein